MSEVTITTRRNDASLIARTTFSVPDASDLALDLVAQRVNAAAADLNVSSIEVFPPALVADTSILRHPGTVWGLTPVNIEGNACFYRSSFPMAQARVLVTISAYRATGEGFQRALRATFPSTHASLVEMESIEASRPDIVRVEVVAPAGTNDMERIGSFVLLTREASGQTDFAVETAVYAREELGSLDDLEDIATTINATGMSGCLLEHPGMVVWDHQGTQVVLDDDNEYRLGIYLDNALWDGDNATEMHTYPSNQAGRAQAIADFITAQHDITVAPEPGADEGVVTDAGTVTHRGITSTIDGTIVAVEGHPTVPSLDADPRRCVACDTEYNGDTLCPECYGSDDLISVTSDGEARPCKTLCQNCGMYSGYEDEMTPLERLLNDLVMDEDGLSTLRSALTSQADYNGPASIKMSAHDFEEYTTGILVPMARRLLGYVEDISRLDI